MCSTPWFLGQNIILPNKITDWFDFCVRQGINMKIFLYFAKLIRTHLSGGGSRGICICFCILEEVVDLAQLHVGPTQTDPIGIHFVVSSSVLTHSPGNDIIFLYKSPFHQNIARGTTDPGYRVYKGTPPEKKNVFFRALPEFPPPLSLSFGQLVHLFSDVKTDRQKKYQLS